MTQKLLEELSDIAIPKFLPFLSTNIYKQGITALISIKAKNRNSIDAEL